MPTTIRSFVRRSGRITSAQERALVTLWKQYGVNEGNYPVNLVELFGRHAEKHLEIGFGSGDALLEMAITHPERDYIGIDVHRPGVGHILLQLEKYQLSNVRIICADAVEVLNQWLLTQSVDVIYLFFPDPWPKKRHHKRRLLQPPFVELLAKCLKIGGYVHLATDWADYAQQMLQVLEMNPHFVNCHGSGCFMPRPLDRPLTRFEQRGQRLGHEVWDLRYQRQNE